MSKMIEIGNTQIPFRGKNDRTDGYDKTIGTFREMVNYYVTKDKQSIKTRYGFGTDVPLPEYLYLNNYNLLTTGTAGTLTDFVFDELLYVDWFRIYKPSEKIIAIAVVLYKYQITLWEYVYTMRYLMYPYWDGTQFVDAWKDITPYYIDERAVNYEEGLTVNASGDYVEAQYFKNMNTCIPNKYDLCGGYIYLNYHNEGAFSEGNKAESDKLVLGSENAVYNFEGTHWTIKMKTENPSLRSTWNYHVDESQNTNFELRIHKNLETGKLPYKYIVSLNKQTFTSYLFSAIQTGDKIIISAYTDDNQYTKNYPSYTLQLDYINKKFFGIGKIWSIYDAGVDTDSDDKINSIYDSRLTYGFPGYDHVMKAITGAKIVRYTLPSSGGGANYYVGIIPGFQLATFAKAYSSYLLVGDLQSVRYSVDNGVTWSKVGYIYSGTPMDGSKAGSDIWVVTIDRKIYKNGDVKYTFNEVMKKVLAVTTSVVIAAGDGGKIYRTTDGGDTWTAVTSGTTQNIIDMSWDGINTIYAITATEVLKSTNSGASWTVITAGSQNKGVSVIDSTHVYVCGNGIYYSSNGSSFNIVNSAQADSIYALNTESIAIISGNKLYHSINGGGNFVLKHEYPQFNSIIIAGYGGILWQTASDMVNKKLYKWSMPVGLSNMQYPPSKGIAVEDNVSGYNKVKGKLVLEDRWNKYPIESDILYTIYDADISIQINDFIMSEVDVHGRIMKYDSFGVDSYETGFVKPVYDKNNLTYWNTYTETSNSCATAEYGEIGFESGKKFFIYCLGVHDGYRAGLHYDQYDTYLTDDTYNIPYLMVHVPVIFNRTMSAVEIGMKESDNDGIEDYLQAKLILHDELQNSGYDFRTTIAVDSGGLRLPYTGGYYQYGYTKEYRISKNMYDKTNIGGNHLLITGNPTYSAGNVYSTGIEWKFDKVMKHDVSYGAQNMLILRGRMFVSKICMNVFQYGEIIGEKVYSQQHVIYSPIGAYGGNYHIFNDAMYYIVPEGIGKITAMSYISAGMHEMVQEYRNNLLILGDSGYLFLDMRSNEPAEWMPIKYYGDGCVAPKSVVSFGGYAIYAGRNGIYLFDGQKQINIMNLGASSVYNTWLSLDDSVKETAMGVYKTNDNQFWLFFNADGWNAFIFDFGDYLIDYEKSDIYHFVSGYTGYNESPPIKYNFLLTRSAVKYIGGTIRMATKDSTGIYRICKYDNSRYWDIGFNTIDNKLILNNILASDKYSRLEYLSYYGKMTGNMYATIDNTSVASISLNTTQKYTEWKIPPNRNTVGNRIGVSFETVRDTPNEQLELYQINMKINDDFAQRRMIKNNGNS